MWQTCLKMYVCKLEELESLGMGLQWAWARNRHGFDFLPTWSNCYRVGLFCCLSNQTPRGGRPCRCQEFHDFSCGFCFWILSFAKLLYRTAGSEEVVSKWRSWRWVCLNIGGHPEFWWLMKRCLIMFPNYSTGHHIGTTRLPQFWTSPKQRAIAILIPFQVDQSKRWSKFQVWLFSLWHVCCDLGRRFTSILFLWAWSEISLIRLWSSRR